MQDDFIKRVLRERGRVTDRTSQLPAIQSATNIQQYLQHTESIIKKVREIERISRTLQSGRNLQQVVDEIFMRYGVIVNPLRDGSEIVTIGGTPIRQGDVEFVKTTSYGFDHFIVYNASPYRNDLGFKTIDLVCKEFGLHAPKKGETTIRLMSAKESRVMAELLGRERPLGSKKEKVTLPYEVVGIRKELSENGNAEEALLYAVVTNVYKASCTPNNPTERSVWTR